MTLDRLLGISKLTNPKKLATDFALHALQGALVALAPALAGAGPGPCATAAAVANGWRELSQWRRTRDMAGELAEAFHYVSGRIKFSLSEQPAASIYDDFAERALRHYDRARWGSPNLLDRLFDCVGYAVGGGLVGWLV